MRLHEFTQEEESVLGASKIWDDKWLILAGTYDPKVIGFQDYEEAEEAFKRLYELDIRVNIYLNDNGKISNITEVAMEKIPIEYPTEKDLGFFESIVKIIKMMLS